MARLARCRHCDRPVEWDDYEEAWFHYDDNVITCDPTGPRSTVATPLYVIEEIPG